MEKRIVEMTRKMIRECHDDEMIRLGLAIFWGSNPEKEDYKILTGSEYPYKDWEKNKEHQLNKWAK